MKCKNCGGELKRKGSQYQCTCCGKVFEEEELNAPRSNPYARETMKPVAHTREKDGADIYEENINGVLEIYWSDGNVISSGSGFLLNKEGFAITNTHVVTTEKGQPVEPLFIKVAGEEVEASIIALGDRHHGLGDGVDLALIKLERVPYEARALRIGDFENVKIGQRVYVIGNSLGQGTCITSGIVSDKEREMEGKNLLMTDCAINGGNSGGPIFNADGEVIGAIVSSIPTAKGMNFAIPSKTVLEFIKAVEKQLKR